MPPANSPLTSKDRLVDICRRWKVCELSLFGSMARGDAHAASDVDVLVTFYPEADWDLWEVGQFAEELEQLFGRSVDLVEERSLINPFRRRAILRDKQVVYAA